MGKIKGICLSYRGNIDEIELEDTLTITTFTKNDVSEYVLGNGILERECDFDYKDKIVSIFAFSEDKDGNINKHELPPPIDNNIYYGDIFVICHNKDGLCNISKKEYKEFYETAFGGFDDIDNETDEGEDDDDDDDGEDMKDFIVSDDDVETSNYSTSSEEDVDDDDEDEDEDEEDDTDELREQYDVYKHYVDSMRKSGKSATKSIQEKMRRLYEELRRRGAI